MPGISTPNICRAVISRARSYAEAKGLPLQTAFRSMGLLSTPRTQRGVERRLQRLEAKGLLGNLEALELFLRPGIIASAKREMKCRQGDELILHRDKKKSLHEEQRVLEEKLAAERRPEPSGGWSHVFLEGRKPRFRDSKDEGQYRFEMERHEAARSRDHQISPEAERILKERGVFGTIEESGWEKVLYQEINAILQEIGALHDQIMSGALGVLDQRDPFVPEKEGFIRLRAGEEENIGGPLLWTEGLDLDRKDIPIILRLLKGGGRILPGGNLELRDSQASGYAFEVRPRGGELVPSGADIKVVDSYVRSGENDSNIVQRQLFYNGNGIFKRAFTEQASLLPQ